MIISDLILLHPTAKRVKILFHRKEHCWTSVFAFCMWSLTTFTLCLVSTSFCHLNFNICISWASGHSHIFASSLCYSKQYFSLTCVGIKEIHGDSHASPPPCPPTKVWLPHLKWDGNDRWAFSWENIKSSISGRPGSWTGNPVKLSLDRKHAGTRLLFSAILKTYLKTIQWQESRQTKIRCWACKNLPDQ